MCGDLLSVLFKCISVVVVMVIRCDEMYVLYRVKKMSTASVSQSPLSQASPSQSQALSTSPQPESDNESRPIEIEDDDDMEVEEEEDGVEAGSKRKLTSAVWTEFKRVKFNGTVRAKCIYCFKQLSATSTNGTKHLHVHLKGCVQRKIKLNGKTMAQVSLRFGKTDVGTVSVENYIFDQDVARRELSAMIVLHEYPLSMVDHVGFRRFVGALQPLFKMGTRNTIRYMVYCMLLHIMLATMAFQVMLADHVGCNFISDLILWLNTRWRGKKPLSTWLELNPE
jgi:hypothetical protein